ncbi:MAG: hypothetical protein P0Y53_21110 [Candidatus Pseudobacter hemicellulosilyticus]|uniref:Uncharacterized protein n=1 Tax=Candidatus Pseudobacter hemicellulosilyticus TaxID=3121375 RepID=A0AAJ5WV63_9BACT|nr:MAG: hypothetical protein P0Y53_21110 [Pseudobacter sp.]
MNKLLAVVLALLTAGLFLFMVLYSSSGFNFIPYLIHEAISPGGAGETTFIMVFDVLAAILLFWLLYKLFARLLIKR